MTLQSAKLVCECICLLAVAGAAGYTAYDLHDTQVRARTSIEQLDQGLGSALNSVNRPCGGGAPCGLLAEANKTMVKVQDIAVTTQRQVSQSAVLVNSASAAIQSAAGDVHVVAGRASDFTAQATTDLKTANETIGAGRPLLASLTRTSDASTLAVEHFDALVQSKDLEDGLHQLDLTSANVAGITRSVDKMTAHLEKNFDSPKPIWKTLIPMSEDAGKIWACAVEHVCVN